MGREYCYCSRCQTRLDTEHFDTGRAARIKDQIACENCLGEIIAPLTFKEQEQILLDIKKARENARPAAAPAAQARSGGTGIRTNPANRPALAPPIDSGRQVGSVLFLGVAILLGALGALYFLFGNPHGEAPIDTPAPREWVRVYRPEAEKPVTRASLAKTALDKAREAAAANAPLETQLALFDKAVREAEGTDYLESARGERDQVQRRTRETVDTELATLDRDAKAFSDKEEFRRAIAVFEQARLRHETAAWAEAITQRATNVTAKDAWLAFIPLRDKAIDAKKKNETAEVKAISDRVARWDLPQFVLELERVLAAGSAAPSTAPTTELKPQSEEAKAYQKLWGEALDLARNRDYDAAGAALKRAADGLKEDASRAEAKADLEALALAASTLKEAHQAIATWPRGEKITFEYLDELLSPARVSEPFVRSDRATIETIRGGEPFVVELSELTPRCLGEIFKARAAARPETDGRAAALLCLVEGDADAAKFVLGGPAESIPWKYWARAAKIAETRGNLLTEAGKRELSARKLYFTAERERLQVRTRGVAIDRYRTLLNDFADTAIVRSRRARISAQRESAKDYLFLGEDLTGAGTFKQVRNSKVGTCWTSDADAVGFAGKNNTLDFTFYAFPDAPYRCWVYVGGCCQETFTCYLQTTDLTVPHPDTKQPLNVDPGAGVSVPVKNSITFLKPRHELHGGPKEPKRWEWISIPLPKYTTAGLKTVRLLTETKGFAVAHAAVSSIRSSPPGDAEMKALLKGPAAPVETPEPVVAAIAPAPEPRDPTLTGHWKLDESGPTALDASGNDNTGILAGDPARGPGKIGNGLLFDGKDRHVNVPASPTLDKIQEGGYTVAAWYKPSSKPADDASHAIFMKAGLSGLRYGGDQKFVMDHALAGTASAAASSAAAYPPGTFYHVAGVVSRTEGSVKLYVNGKLEGTAAFPAGTAARDFAGQTWKIGAAAAGKWASDGAVDDVRLYARSLQPNDVRILSGGTSAGPLTLSISSPGPSERFDAGASITISAHVGGGDGRIARVDFYQGTHLLGSDPQGPWVHAWKQVPAGMYTLTVRAVDKGGAVYASAPVTIRVGNAELYRAINLGGGALKVDGLQWEARNARNVSTKGEVDKLDADLAPPPDPTRATMLRSFLHAKEGTSVSLNPIPNGTYQVYLTVVEDGAPETFDLLIKGRVVQSKYVSGPAGRWERVGPWFVDVTDGVLEVSARGGEAGFCGLEVWRVAK